jgi:hypothetical protein
MRPLRPSDVTVRSKRKSPLTRRRLEPPLPSLASAVLNVKDS